MTGNLSHRGLLKSGEKFTARSRLCKTSYELMIVQLSDDIAVQVNHASVILHLGMVNKQLMLQMEQDLAFEAVRSDVPEVPSIFHDMKTGTCHC